MRLFLGLPLPPSVLAMATDVQSTVMKCADQLPTRLRPIALDTHGHITLVFLGESHPDTPTLLHEKLQSNFLANPLAHASISVRPQAAAFNRKASLIYVSVSPNQELHNIQQTLRETSTRLIPRIENDRKEFNAHITIARANGGIRTAEQRRNVIRKTNESIEDQAEISVPVNTIVLYHSTREGQGEEEKLVYNELWKLHF